MKHLEIKSPQYTFLLQNFKQWLDIIGYAETTVNSLPDHVQELLHFLEQKNITQITQLKSRHISDFSLYLKGRKNRMHGGGLSASHINKALQAVNTFARYLNQTGRHVIDVTPKRLINEADERTILTQTEIKQLYESTYEPHSAFNSLAMGQRDRAIIAMFYGCGLRKDEGTRLNISDIDLNRKLVFVRKGKGNKQRYVPIANKHAEDIRSYIEEGRNWFLLEHRAVFYYKFGNKKTNTDDEAFFLNTEGKRMNSFYQRFAYMRERAGIEKHFSTHNLRHSIATHLLQSGMPIEEIAKFLGHGCLESTQIYTHIVNKMQQQTSINDNE
ncbi:MAG TPA: tyrosine-type recombinase/integrase [Bacteroidales bacterium]|nr:tyrosine-type recombinase/integrase [Bacteroidales bacterium]HNW97527.1 tyrosine-type recombinase/integrase [Bacteroidales bacterium]HPS16565.1 tyrosine-type recombinase/integrase [Bacteroidales bacterium]HPS16573.1 tyrosine-type recombinase/integrase [Bacteroidales bacterium]